jgi:hypothetical protein
MRKNGMSPSLTLAPEWLAHRFDERTDSIHFVQAPRELRRRVPFLIDEHLPGAANPMPISRAEAMSAAPQPAPIHFIFHSAYCCSTLLAAVLDIRGVATSYKEPQILNDMVGWRHRGGAPPQIAAVLDHALHLLSRPFETGEACIVKPSNIVNGLIDAMLKLRPDARVLLLHAPLREFVTSIARKGMPGRLWVRELLSRQLAERYVDLGFEPRDYLLHTDLQVAAVGWLAQQKHFSRLAQQWPARVRTLNSELLTARPAEAVQRSSTWFQLTPTSGALEAAIDEQFARNTKDGSAFAPGQREAARREGALLHGEEIDRVVIWAEAVARHAEVPLELSLGLLD